METKNLDKLIEQAKYNGESIILAIQADVKQRELEKLFGTHGPALVTALKLCMVSWEADQEKPFPYRAYSAVKELLTKLDQEATL